MLVTTDLTLIAGSGAIGWLMGAPLTGAAGKLEAGFPRPLPRGLLADPFLQGFQALVFGALAWRFGLSAQLAIYGALSLVLTLVLFIDLRTRFVYSVVAYPGILAGIVLSPVADERVAWDGLASAALGAAVLGALYLLGRLLYRGGEPLATGDIVVGALVGSVVGLGRLFPAIFYGIVLSGLIAILFALRFRSLRQYLPYGPGLCLGALIVLLQ